MRFKLWGHDPSGKRGMNEGAISERGEVITRSFDYSIFDFETINSANTAFNFVKPKTGLRFVMTGVVISGNRDIGVNGAVLTIYEASTLTSTTVLSTPFEIEVPKSTVLPFIVPNVILGEGNFLNGKADDTTVRVGLFGYFVPV